MAGQLDSLFKEVAKQVVADLGNSLDTDITYIRKTASVYNSSTGAVTTTDVSYNIKAPIEFIDSLKKAGFQENRAKGYTSLQIK